MEILRCSFCGWMDNARKVPAGSKKCPGCGKPIDIYVNPVTHFTKSLNPHELKQLYSTFSGATMMYGNEPYYTFGSVGTEKRKLTEKFLGFPEGTGTETIEKWFVARGLSEREMRNARQRRADEFMHKRIRKKV